MLRCVVISAIFLFLHCSLPTAATAADENRDQRLREEAAMLCASQPDPAACVRLIMIDLELSTDLSDDSRSTCRSILRTLALSADDNALQHVRSVFENEPERRGMAAWAISQAALQHPTDLQDWRLMVRSLPVIRSDDAISVLKALKRYRNRANKSQWVRQVILTGLRLPPDAHQHATALLKHWTTQPTSDAAPWSLAQYQQWFVKEYPDSAPPSLPVDQPGRKWTMAALLPEVLNQHPSAQQVLDGAVIYDKAGCRKCHQRSSPGPLPGPDLTSLGWRRQKEEILQSLLYPSQELHEEYPVVTVQLKDGTQFSGLMQAAPNEQLGIISSSGERRQFPAKDVEAIRNQPVSNMPEGTIEMLSREEILALIAYLTSVDGIPRPHSDEE